jgi:integrase
MALTVTEVRNLRTPGKYLDGPGLVLHVVAAAKRYWCIVALRRAGYDGCSVHGMRSMFRDWCADTGQPADLAEMSLAHTVGNAVERSYRRSDVIDRRRALMSDWASYVTRPPAAVIPLRSVAAA